MADEEVVMLCMTADAPNTLPGSSYKHVCAKCGARLMMSPSGQKTLAKAGKPVALICPDCFMKAVEASTEPVRVLPPTPEQIAELRKGIEPNTWKERN